MYSTSKNNGFFSESAEAVLDFRPPPPPPVASLASCLACKCICICMYVQYVLHVHHLECCTSVHALQGVYVSVVERFHCTTYIYMYMYMTVLLVP